MEGYAVFEAVPVKRGVCIAVNVYALVHKSAVFLKPREIIRQTKVICIEINNRFEIFDICKIICCVNIYIRRLYTDVINVCTAKAVVHYTAVFRNNNVFYYRIAKCISADSLHAWHIKRFDCAVAEGAFAGNTKTRIA